MLERKETHKAVRGLSYVMSMLADFALSEVDGSSTGESKVIQCFGHPILVPSSSANGFIPGANYV